MQPALHLAQPRGFAVAGVGPRSADAVAADSVVSAVWLQGTAAQHGRSQQ